MAHFNLDDVYIAVSEEALFAADQISKKLNVSTNTPEFDDIVVVCGRVFKIFFEHDHEMGLSARQKILRGLIERTQLSHLYFQHISQEFKSFVEHNNSSLFAILNSLESDVFKIQDLAKTFYDYKEFDPLFLYGSWVDSSLSVDNLRHLQTAMQSLQYIYTCSFTPQLNTMYKFHKIDPNATFSKQTQAVVHTLASRDPEKAHIFEIALTTLHRSHPTFVENCLRQLYFMNMTEDEQKNAFHISHVLNGEQLEALHKATTDLNSYWKQIPIVCLFSTKWAKDVAARALYIMEGMGQDQELIVEFPIEGVKTKIEERRAQLDALPVRASLKT